MEVHKICCPHVTCGKPTEIDPQYAPMGKRAMRYFLVAALLRAGQIERYEYNIPEDVEIVPTSKGEVNDEDEQRAVERGRLGKKRRGAAALQRQQLRELAEAEDEVAMNKGSPKKADAPSAVELQLAADQLATQSEELLSDSEDEEEKRKEVVKAGDMVALLVAGIAADKDFIPNMRHKLLTTAEYLEHECDIHLNERIHTHHHHAKKQNVHKDAKVEDAPPKIVTVEEVENVQMMPGQEPHSSYNQVAAFNLNQLIKQTIPRVPQKSDGAHAANLNVVLGWPFEEKKAHLLRYIRDKLARIIQINHKRPVLDRQVALLERKLQAREVEEGNEAHAKAYLKMLVAEAEAAADVADQKARAAAGESDESDEEEDAGAVVHSGGGKFDMRKYDAKAERREKLRVEKRREHKKQKKKEEEDFLKRARAARGKIRVVKPRRERCFVIEQLPTEKSVKRVLLALREEAARQGRCWKPVKLLNANQKVKLRVAGEAVDPSELTSGSGEGDDVIIRGKMSYGGGQAGHGEGDQMLSWIRDAAGDGKSQQKDTGVKNGRRNSVSTMAALDGTTMAARIVRCKLELAGYYACVHRGVQMAERVRIVCYCSTSPTPKKGSTVQVSVWMFADRFEQEAIALREEMEHRQKTYWSMVMEAGVRDLRLRRFAQVCVRVRKDNVSQMEPPKSQPYMHVRKQAQAMQLLGYTDPRFYRGWREEITVAERTKKIVTEDADAEVRVSKLLVL
jgi:hypothetical protein